MRHPLFLTSILVLLAAGSWWLVNDTPQPARVRQVPNKRQVDYYLRDLDTLRMDQNGTPDHRLSAREVRHFDNDNTTELTEPRLTIYQAGSPPWVIDASRGWISAKGDQVLLPGEVTITRAAAPGIKPLQLVTSNLRVQPHRDYAETDEKVRVRSDQDHIEAVGMHAWFGTPPRIKFLSDVKGYYAPPPQ